MRRGCLGLRLYSAPHRAMSGPDEAPASNGGPRNHVVFT